MKIQDLLKQAKPCWKYAATDKNGTIYFYREKTEFAFTSGLVQVETIVR